MYLVSAKRKQLSGPKQREVAANKAVKDLVAALKIGQIHPELSERLRLLPTDTQQAREFQAAINQIYQMLVKAGKVELKDSQFLLFDDREGGVHAPNAFYLPSSGKLFGFATGFIRGEKAVTYDELAHVVLHELFHRHVRDKHLGAYAKVNKFEEGAADLYTLYCWMRDVGANPRVVVEALSKELSDRAQQHGGSVPIEWGEIDDVHISKRTTRLLMEAALTALEIKRGDCPDQATPLSEWRVDLGRGSSKSLSEIVGNYEYIGPVGTGLKAAGFYTETDSVSRADIFCRVFNDLSYCNATRASEAAEALLTLRLNPAVLAESVALDRIADSVLRVISPENFHAVHRIYSNLCLRTANFGIHQPLGRLKLLASAANDFIKATHRQDILRFAAEFVRLATAEPLARADWFAEKEAKFRPIHELCGDGFPRFPKCAVEAIVPWNRHLTECVLGRGRIAGWQEVVRSLRILGVVDPRIWQESRLGALQGELLSGVEVGVSDEVRAERPNAMGESCRLGSCYVYEGRLKYHSEAAKELLGRKLLLALEERQWNEQVQIPKDPLSLSAEQVKLVLSKMGREHPEYCGELLARVFSFSPVRLEKMDIEALGIIGQFLALNSDAPRILYRLVGRIMNPMSGSFGALASTPAWLLVSKHGSGLSDLEKLEVVGQQYAGQRDINGSSPLSLNTSHIFTEHHHLVKLEELEKIVLPLASRVLGRDLKLPRTLEELSDLFSSEELARYPCLEVTFHAVGLLALRSCDLNIPSIRRLVSSRPGLERAGNDAVSEIVAVKWCQTEIKRASIIDEVRDWLFAQQQGIAPAVELFQRLERILSVTEGLGAERRLKIMDMLLSSSRQISDVIALRRINRIYSEALAERLGGVDNESDEYFDGLKVVVSRLARKVPIVNRRELFAEIADRLCTQERCSYLLRDNLNLFAEEQLTMGSFRQMLVDGSLNVLAKSAELRGDVIDLLMSRAEPESIDQFLYARLPSLSLSDPGLRSGNALSFSSGFGANREFTIVASTPEALKLLNLLRAEARKFHESFWEVPLYARAAFVAELYFPDGVIGVKVDAVADAILARAIPDSAPGADVGRAWWKSYILGLPPYKIPYYLAATLSAGHPGVSSDRKAGDIIADIADILDPVSRKLIQVGSGHPGLPEVLRPSPERVRCELSVPTRWEYWQLINSQLSEELRNDIKYLGPVKKAGSIFVAGSAYSRMHGPATLLVERDYVRETSATGVKNLKRMVSGRGADPAAEEVSRSIEAAYNLLLEELQSATLPQRAAAMVEEYAKYKIIVDDKEVTFSSAGLLKSEARGKLLRTAPGIELASAVRTDESPELRVVLMAVLTRELVGILSGSRFCDDRHSGNCNKHGLSVEHYDHGGMAITPPSEDELSKLGDVISVALSNSATPDELLPKLTGALTDAAEEGSYIARVRKALQTLAEYTLYLPKDDVRSCFAASVIEMHPIIKLKVAPAFFAKVAQPGFSELIGSAMAPAGLRVRAVRLDVS